MTSVVKGLIKRFKRFGIIRTFVFLIWYILPLDGRRGFEMGIAKFFKYLNKRAIGIQVNDVKIFIDPSCKWAIQRYFIIGKYFKDAEIETVKKKVAREFVFFDIGANYGIWAFSLKEHFKSVYVIEPNPFCITCLRKSISLCKASNIFLIQGALSDKEGKGNIFYCEGHSGDGRIYVPEGEIRPRFTEISRFTFDSITKLFSINDDKFFIKMDTQGSEPDILKGMEESLKKAHEIILFSEVHEPSLKAAGYSIDLYFSLLEEKGFWPINFDGNFERVSWEEARLKVQGQKDFFFRYLKQ